MKFSNKTKQPRKQRKALYHAPMHKRQSRMNVHLSKELRLKHKKRALIAKKGDKIRILRGSFMKREGKIVEADLKSGKLFIEGILRKKQGGKEVLASLEPSNCMLVEYMEPKMKEKKNKVKS